ncbi:IlGF domain-containing protein [Aphelenchoides bicaudatus]|nr:IlGF domain-containing protein [Aphelenchoides bicaudatus]
MRFTVLFFLFSLMLVGIQAKKYCGSAYTSLRDRTCTFAQQTSACLGPDEPSIRQKCCDKGCSIVDIQRGCCFTEACLSRCYPHRNERERKQKLGEVY